MRYIIRELFFHLGEDSDITDEQGRPVLKVDGKVLTLHDTLIVRDPAGAEVARVQRQLIRCVRLITLPAGVRNWLKCVNS